MALSNWDTAAIDERSQPTNGVFCSPLGVVVQFYKNWLYVEDKIGWQPHGAFVEPTVAQIDEGVMWYKDVHIVAWRGPAQGIYAVVWSGRNKKLCCMVGCGVYGFLDNGTWTGVTQEHVDFLKAKIPPPIKYPDPPDPTWGGAQGVERAERIGAYFNEIASLIEKQEEGVLQDDTIRELGLDFTRMLRFNQGDAYFAATLSLPPGEVSTPVGQSHRPMLLQSLENNKDESVQ